LNEGKFVVPSAIVKYAFRIRTRSGLIVDKLLIHGRDEVDAERNVERRLALCRRCFSAWRERLRAESVLAMLKPEYGTRKRAMILIWCLLRKRILVSA